MYLKLKGGIFSNYRNKDGIKRIQIKLMKK